MTTKNITDQKIKTIIENLPTDWIDILNSEIIEIVSSNYYISKINSKEVELYIGNSKVRDELLTVLIESQYSQTIESLNIGMYSTSNEIINYENSINVLSKGFFPNLKKISIGEFRFIFDKPKMCYGKIGDMTNFLRKTPNLEKLEILGAFELNKKINFHNLIHTKLSEEYLYSNFDNISQKTLDNFLLSNLPKLERLDMRVLNNLTFPQEFLDNKTTPELYSLYISGFSIEKDREIKLLKDFNRLTENNITDQKIKNIVENLPSDWIDLIGYSIHDIISSNYYSFEINSKKVELYIGNSNVRDELLTILIESQYSQTIESLDIGRYNTSNEMIDYENSINILSKGFFPNLKEFSIGEFGLIYNGETCYGKIGNITNLFKKMPRLEKLEILGTFELKEKIKFLHLERAKLISQKYGVSNIDRDISQKTLNNFLLSSLPKLEILEISVFDDSTFTLPQEFLDNKTTPELYSLVIEGGFLTGEDKKILNSEIGDIVSPYIEYMVLNQK